MDDPDAVVGTGPPRAPLCMGLREWLLLALAVAAAATATAVAIDPIRCWGWWGWWWCPVPADKNGDDEVDVINEDTSAPFIAAERWRAAWWWLEFKTWCWLRSSDDSPPWWTPAPVRWWWCNWWWWCWILCRWWWWLSWWWWWWAGACWAYETGMDRWWSTDPPPPTPATKSCKHSDWSDVKLPPPLLEELLASSITTQSLSKAKEKKKTEKKNTLIESRKLPFSFPFVCFFLQKEEELHVCFVFCPVLLGVLWSSGLKSGDVKARSSNSMPIKKDFRNKTLEKLFGGSLGRNLGFN